MSLEEIAELYHRYVNTLQIFCPRKDMLGGVGWGWYVCTGFSTNDKCLVYVVTDEEEDRLLTQDINQVFKCGRRQIQSNALKEELKLQNPKAATPLTDAITQKERVDVLLIEGKDADYIVQELLRRNVLRHVDQLSVVLNTVNNATSVSDYQKQILLFKALHQEGFRIFHFERDPNHVFSNNPWRTGCYTVCMMREREVEPPIAVPEPKSLEAMDDRTLVNTYFSFVMSNEVLCKEILRVGDIDDGGWDVCVDDKYRPSSPCLVYSFGIGLEDQRRSKLQWFHNLGLSDKNSTITRKNIKWKMMDLKSIRTSLGHNDRQIDILKMDIEGSEWLAVPNILETGILNHVKQLYLEIHVSVNNRRARDWIPKLDLLRQLHDVGFRLFWSHPNQVHYNTAISIYTKRHVSSCYELYYVNINL
ncbi:uncharacterized protein LOC132553123 [Ylistrum balloti]|uniref:uncharacterized protein LOC132553123 n=1 Tax=Ylistrum balloti TaxID=509963 RepID=UPI002905D171|nr:uncharacterized protein LOC132553123 [Ylistrum balloti]